jgi:hypothetical protein
MLLAHAPEELTEMRLRRLGEGIGKVVYASDHWVVKRERSPREIVALIGIWKVLRRVERVLPWGRKLIDRPSRQIRMLRVFVQGAMLIVPRSLWFARHLEDVWRIYHTRSTRGERLAAEYLADTGLVPRHVEFPPTRVKVRGWPGWLQVSEATERVEATLHQRLIDLARAGRYGEVEVWLDRLLELRQSGWELGLFSTDAHLKNFGVTGDRVVLLDPGGLTDDWAEVESRLSFEEVVTEPHIQLGLGSVLGGRADVAERFNAKWKAVVNRGQVMQLLNKNRRTVSPAVKSQQQKVS